MLIRIMYKDGRQDRVKRAQLKDLIEHCQITMFKRFSGWVSVLCDPTREKNYSVDEYDGRERRSSESVKNIFLDEPSDL